ncbi:MAG: hypothetical protein BWY77_00899 [bacterium ADurb.Bin431]|nr:MAG: hypothetical protein BWY77_00899 [bacterium ADurb.Bin431]
MAVGAGAGTAPAHLDAETVIEQLDEEVVVDLFRVKRKDAEAFLDVVGEEMEVGDGAQPGEEAGFDLFFTGEHIGHPHPLLEFDGEGGADGLEEAGRAPVLARLDIVHEAVFSPGIGPVDGSAAGLVRHPQGVERGVEKKDPRTARSAEELVGTEKDGIQPGQGVGRMHVDGDIGGGGGEIDKTQAAVLVHDAGHLVIGGADAGDVGAGGEGADLHLPVAVDAQQAFEIVEIDPALCIRFDHLDIGDAFQPGGLVGVVLHVGDKDHRAGLLWKIEIVCQLLREAQAEDALPLVHSGGHAGTGGDEHIIGAGMDMPLDALLGKMISPGHAGAGDTRFRMGVADKGAETAGHGLLDRPVEAPARGPVRIDDAMLAVGGRKTLIVSDDVVAEGGEAAFERARHGTPAEMGSLSIHPYCNKNLRQEQRFSCPHKEVGRRLQGSGMNIC